jgi:serine/alanine adding enzyme
VTELHEATPELSDTGGDREADIRIDRFEGDADGWDAALKGLQGSSFCHRLGWRAVMEDALGHETFWWAARNGSGALVGLLPLVRVRSRLFGDYLVSMPFLNYGGPVGSDAARAALARHAARQAGTLGVDLLELRGRIETSVEGLVLNNRKLTVLKSLPESSEELWEKGIKAKLRSQIRRPMKEGMEVRFGPDQLDAFYGVFSTTMRDLGTPVLPRRFFESIRANLDDCAMFVVVEHGGVPLAAGCGLSWGDELEITWAGSSREHQRLAPNMLLYWGMMEEATKRGLRYFNFGRCSPDSGTHRFKRQWGSEDHPLPWLQWSTSGVPSTPSPDSPKFRLATSVWSRMPLPVANTLGPHLSRLIP